MEMASASVICHASQDLDVTTSARIMVTATIKATASVTSSLASRGHSATFVVVQDGLKTALTMERAMKPYMSVSVNQDGQALHVTYHSAQVLRSVMA